MTFWRFIFCACLLSVIPDWAMAQHSPQDDALPQWEEEDHSLMLRGEWFAGQELLPLQSDKPDPEVEALALDIPDSPPSGDSQEIPPQFIPQYMPEREDIFLLDPQMLLTEIEHLDLANLLEHIKEETGVQIYLTLFDKEQKIPAALNAPSLARQIFGNRTSLMLVEYHMDALARSQVVYSEDLGFCLDDRKRKELRDAAQKNAAEYSENGDMLWHLIETLGHQIPTIINLGKMSPLAPKIQIPKVDYVLEPKESAAAAKPKIPVGERIGSLWQAYGPATLAILGSSTILFLAFAFWRHRKIYPLHSHPVRKRLGAPYGSSTTRAIHYGGQVSKSKLEKDLLRDFFD